MNKLGAEWANAAEEYEVLCDLLVPHAKDAFAASIHDWDASDAKALGILGIAAAAVAVLITVHDEINRLWWIPAIGCAAAGGLLIASVWTRTVDLGPDLFDFHDELRDKPPLAAARAMLDALMEAADANNATLADKVALFWVSLVLLAASLVGAIPIALLRP